MPLLKRLSPLIVVILFAACTVEEVPRPLPVELTRHHTCEVCLMISADIEGAKAQIHYKNDEVYTFCCTLHMFSFYLRPDRPHNILAIYVNDMGGVTPGGDAGPWIDAEKAYYLYGSSIKGSHGEALTPFSDLKIAEEYLNEYGGRIVRFNEVTLDMIRPKVNDN